MARNAFMIFHANTIQENKRQLQRLCCKNEAANKSREDTEKLLCKLNYNCQIKSIKDDEPLSCWYHKNVANYTYGPIPGFPSGSWWGIRMDCSRDHVHDPFNEDIQDGPFGVTSICTSNINANQDVDFGDSLTVTGMKYIDQDSSTDPLIKNYEDQVPVRLIRSYNLLNEFAPKTGYRYDGMYFVTDFWIGINLNGTRNYKFALTRLSNQEPASWGAKSPLVTKKSFSTIYPIRKSCSENNPVGTYEFRKYSHSSNNISKRGRHEQVKEAQPSDVEGKVDKLGTVSESAIVTRHVFKKTNTNVDHTAIPSTSTSESNSFSQIRAQASKANSTNISIRTGLYDSSHSVQQETKKNVLLPFCRTTKQVNIIKTNSHSPDGKSQASVSNEISKRVDYSSLTGKSELKVKHVANNAANGNEQCNKRMVNGAANDNTERSKVLNSEVADSAKSKHSYESKILAHKTPEVQDLASFDSLTPDKILNLISQKKYHPLSKLLMGNMIGLTSEQSIALKICEPTEKDQANNNVEESIEKNLKVSEDLIGARCYKFRRRKRLTRKMLNKLDMRSDKCTNKLEKNCAQSFDILGPNPTSLSTYNSAGGVDTSNRAILYTSKCDTSLANETEQRGGLGKRITRNSKRKSEGRRDTRTLLRAKKHIHKKKRREIANLSIDAKIGPKIRGPRNRRLRCINTVCTKRSYEPFSTVICALNKCKITNMSVQRNAFNARSRVPHVSGYKRIRNNRRVSADRKYNKMGNQSSQIGEGLSNNNVHSIGDNTDKSQTQARAKSVRPCETFSNKKKKSRQAAPAISNIQLQNYNKEVVKPCTTDAITQCSLIKEPFSSTNSASLRNIKVEYHSHMKTETHETIISDDENYEEHETRTYSCVPNETHKYCTETECEMEGTVLSLNDNSLGIEELDRLPSERVSAFVPVNMLDSDRRIARLRSIGFKPIPMVVSEYQLEEYPVACSSKVMKQDVAEKYNKYTNEENNVVVYMDDELQYQDIEDEDTFPRKRRQGHVKNSKGDPLKKAKIRTEKKNSLAKDLESAWHGWKKVVTNGDSHWIGW